MDNVLGALVLLRVPSESMMIMKPRYLLFGLAVLASSSGALLLGCGGGGGGAAGGGAKVGFYVTDDIRTGTDAVWGTVFKVELLASDSSVTTIFDDTTGKEFNFRALNNGANNLYMFLAKNSVPTGKTFNQVAVTMSNQLRVLETGDNSSSLYTLLGTAAGAGKVRIAYNLPTPRTFTTGDAMAIDFDLGNFVISGANVTPSLRDNNRQGIEDDSRHNSDDVKGTVSELAGSSPNFTFVLTGPYGQINVQTTSGTVFFNSDSSASPTISNGRRVKVEGILDGTTGVFQAYKVKVKVGNGLEDPHEAKGQDSNLNAEAGTMQLEVFESEGFVPADRNILVATTGSTIYRANNGSLLTKAEFFAQLANSASLTVEAEGTYSASNNTLSATKLKLEDEDDDHDEPNDSDVRGQATNLNAVAGTLTVTNAVCEGFICPSPTLNVTTSGSTEFKDANNENVSQAAWFAELAARPSNDRPVKVEGTWNGTVFAAREIKIREED